jgi:Uma2 family endonuclease
MTPAERERLVDQVNEALSDPQRLIGEGRPHKKAKSRAADMMGLHFRTLGRSVYLAEDMSVMYPGEVAFSPDVLAVVDMVQPEDDARMAWIVADEQRGLDFVLEVAFHGDRRKDLVENVERYARLGIPEYFVYDRARQRIHAYRLTSPGAGRYQPIVPQAGRYASRVLGLDMVIQGGALRLFCGSAELIGSDDLIERLSGMVSDLEAKAERAEAEAERAEQAVAGLRQGVLAVLEARGVACPNEARARVMACDDPLALQRWLARATSARSAGEALEG